MLVISLQDEIDSALASGMNGYITKPVNKEELFSVLSQYLIDNPEYGQEALKKLQSSC